MIHERWPLLDDASPTGSVVTPSVRFSPMVSATLHLFRWFGPRRQISLVPNTGQLPWPVIQERR